MFKFARLVLGAGIIFGASAAMAGDLRPDEADAIMDACRADYHELCPRVVPGDGRVARCLMDHERDLAPRCLQSLKAASAAEDCEADYRRLCRDVPKGKEAFQCLADRMDRLEPACRRVVAANAPYMQSREERYSYNDPYNSRPSPDRPGYEGPYSGSSAYNGRMAPGEAYDAGRGPDGRRGDPRYDGERPRGEAPEPYRYGPGYTDRYAGGGFPRSRPDDDEDEVNYPRPRYGEAARPPY
jgi:hypothetical protein